MQRPAHLACAAPTGSTREGVAIGGGVDAGGSSMTTRRPGALSSSLSAPPCKRAIAAASESPRPEPGMVRDASSLTKRSSTRSRCLRRHALPAILDRKADQAALPLRRQAQRGGRSRRRRYAVFQPVVQRLGAPARSVRDCRARQMFRIDLAREGDAALLGDGFVEFGDIARDCGRVESLHLRTRCRILRARSSAARRICLMSSSASSIIFSSEACSAPGSLVSRSAASALFRRRVNGVRRSCAILSDTSFMPLSSVSIRASMALRLSASRSSLVAAAGDRKRAGEIAAHDGGGRRRHRVDAQQHAAATRRPPTAPINTSQPSDAARACRRMIRRFSSSSTSWPTSSR